MLIPKNERKREILIDGNIHKTPSLVSSSLDLGDHVILLFDYSDVQPQEQMSRNVVAVDRDGRQIWRIERSADWLRDDGSNLPNPFISVNVDPKTGTIYVCEMAGRDCDLNPKTGRLSNPRWTK